VGALQSRIGRRVLTCYPPDDLSNVRIDRPGVYDVPRRRASSRELLPAGITIVGTMRAWIALVLHACELFGIIVIYVHTDGFACIGNPLPALVWASLHGGPGIAHWKVRAVDQIEAWAANQRITRFEDGTEEVAGGGISRLLSMDEVRGQLRAARAQTRDSGWQTGKRIVTSDGWTRAPLLREIDVHLSDRLEKLQ